MICPKWTKIISSRWRQPLFWISSITHKLVYCCTYLHEIWHVYYVGGPTCTYAKILNKNKIQPAILDFCTNSNNSAADWRRWMEFCSNVDSCYRKWNIWPKWTKIINSRWRRPPFWISFIAHNSFVIAHNCTKFGMWITFEVLHTSMPKYWTKIKSKMAAAILDFCTIAITQPPIDID